MQAHKYIKTEFSEIQEVYNVFYSRDFPNPLLRADGTLVRNVHEWEAQKASLRELAQEHMYGTWPHKPDRLTGHCFFSEPAFSGKGLCEKHRLDVVYEETSFTMEISIYRPADVHLQEVDMVVAELPGAVRRAVERVNRIFGQFLA